MPTLDRQSVPALVLLVGGVALVAGAFVLFPHAGDPAYVHTVEPIAADEVPAEANVTNFSELSPEGQEAFRRSVESSDGTYVVREEADKPPEFFYSDYAEWNRGIYVIRYEGEYYRLSTAAGGGLGFVAYGIKLLLGLLGAGLALAGGVSLAREDARTPAAVLAGLAAATALLGLVVVVPLGLFQLLPVAAAGFVVAAALTYRYGRRPARRTS